jgi:hypothetical protein
MQLQAELVGRAYSIDPSNGLDQLDPIHQSIKIHSAMPLEDLCYAGCLTGLGCPDAAPSSRQAVATSVLA